MQLQREKHHLAASTQIWSSVMDGMQCPGAPGPGGMIPGFSGYNSGCPAALGS